MTAKELIDYLTTLSPDTVVSVHGYEGGINDATYVKAIQVLLDVNPEWYYGLHEEDDEDTRALYEAKGTAINTAPRVLLG